MIMSKNVRKIGKQQNSKNIMVDWVKIGRLGKSETSSSNKERKNHEGEVLCKLMIEKPRTIVRDTHCCRRLKKRINVFSAFISKELPCPEARRTPEQELTYARDLGVYVKVDERQAIAKYHVTLVDTKWIITNRTSPCKSGRESCQENSKVDRPDLYAVNSFVGSVESNNLHSSESQTDILNHIQRRVLCLLSGLVLVCLPVEDRMGADAGKFWIVEKECVWHAGRSKQLGP